MARGEAGTGARAGGGTLPFFAAAHLHPSGSLLPSLRGGLLAFSTKAQGRGTGRGWATGLPEGPTCSSADTLLALPEIGRNRAMPYRNGCRTKVRPFHAHGDPLAVQACKRQEHREMGGKPKAALQSLPFHGWRLLKVIPGLKKLLPSRPCCLPPLPMLICKDITVLEGAWLLLLLQ